MSRDFGSSAGSLRVIYGRRAAREKRADEGDHGRARARNETTPASTTTATATAGLRGAKRATTGRGRGLRAVHEEREKVRGPSWTSSVHDRLRPSGVRSGQRKHISATKRTRPDDLHTSNSERDVSVEPSHANDTKLKFTTRWNRMLPYEYTALSQYPSVASTLTLNEKTSGAWALYTCCLSFSIAELLLMIPHINMNHND